MTVVGWIADNSISSVPEQPIEPFVYRNQGWLEPSITFFDLKYPYRLLGYAREVDLLCLARMSSNVVFTLEGVCEGRLSLIQLSRRRSSSNIYNRHSEA